MTYRKKVYSKEIEKYLILPIIEYIMIGNNAFWQIIDAKRKEKTND